MIEPQQQPTIISAVVLEHARSCPALTPGNDEECTCGLEWRMHLETEKTMHAAWMKRANEAEARINQLESAILEARKVTTRECAKAICPMCAGAERGGPDNYYEAKPEVVWARAQYVSNFGPIEACYAHIGGSVEFVPCAASAIWRME